MFDVLNHGSSVLSGQFAAPFGVGRIGFEGGGFDEIRLRSGGSTNFYDGNFESLEIDSIAIIAVPEPEIYAMLLAGLGLIGYSLRRRQAF